MDFEQETIWHVTSNEERRRKQIWNNG